MALGCAGPVRSTGGSDGTTYSGVVWLWDERENTVTLLQPTGMVRVKVTPDQLVGLRRHESVTIRGVPAPPPTIEHRVVPAPATTAVPAGPAQHAETPGTIVGSPALGMVTIEASQGRLVVWTDTAQAGDFRPGMPVTVRMSVQPMTLVRASAGTAPAPPPTPIATEPGHHAIVTGAITEVGRGTITVDSPRGPVTVSVPDPARFRPGDTVQLTTSVRSGS